jgi:Sulfotransferase family
MNRLPQFVILGAAKSASTWLHLSLRQHPAVYMPGGETPFFEDPYYQEGDLSALGAELQSAPPDAVVGIKCPNYLCTPECAPRLAKYLPHARLIAILRNPVDRAVSQYYHLIRSGRFPMLPADTAFTRYLAGQFDPPYAQQIVMGFGLYAEGIANYRRVFPPEQLLILTDLDMRNSSLDVFKRVCRFLEIDDGFVPRGISVPRNQGVYSSPLLSFVQSLNQRGRTYHASTGLDTLRPGFAGWGARRLAILVSRVSAAMRIFVRQQEPSVSLKTRAGLLAFYLPDIQKLEKMTDIELSAWKDLRQV